MSSLLGPRLMGADLATVERLESATLAAVPARSAWALPGWWCVADDGGWVGRANAATPVPVPEGTGAADLRTVASSYRRRGLPPKVRWTPVAPPSLASQAKEDGWVAAGETLVMTATDADAPVPRRPAAHGTVELGPTATPDWSGLYLLANSDGSGPARLRLALAAPEPKAYATVTVDGSTAAIGLGVTAGDLLGIFDVVTAPQHRREGHASQVMAALRRWGADRGATLTYLQVHGANAAAIALYEDLGFTVAYSYTYLTPAAGRPRPTADPDRS